jgi:hypothetical protein
VLQGSKHDIVDTSHISFCIQNLYKNLIYIEYYCFFLYKRGRICLYQVLSAVI